MSNRAAAIARPVEHTGFSCVAEVDLSRVPDPQPGWVSANPDRALAFFFVTPRPCAALEELMQLK